MILTSINVQDKMTHLPAFILQTEGTEETDGCTYSKTDHSHRSHRQNIEPSHLQPLTKGRSRRHIHHNRSFPISSLGRRCLFNWDATVGLLALEKVHFVVGD